MKLQSIAILLLVLTGQATAQNKPTPTQAEAIAAIEKLGGSVRVDLKKPGKPVIAVSFYRTNTKVSKVTDAGLVHLKGLTELQTLQLANTKVTDAGLVHLKGLTKLQKLELYNTKVTDAGLMHLNGLTNLKSWASATPKSPTPGSCI